MNYPPPREGVPSELEYDAQGNLVGSGLTLVPTAHQFRVEQRALFAWCAFDTLTYPVELHLSAQSPRAVRSPEAAFGSRSRLNRCLIWTRERLRSRSSLMLRWGAATMCGRTSATTGIALPHARRLCRGKGRIPRLSSFRWRRPTRWESWSKALASEMWNHERADWRASSSASADESKAERERKEAIHAAPFA